MAHQVYIDGAETTEKTAFQGMGANTTVSTLNVKSGTYSYKQDYGTSITTGTTVNAFLRQNGLDYHNWSAHVDFMILGTPLFPANIIEDSVGNNTNGDARVIIDTDKKIKLVTYTGTSPGTTAGTTVLGTGTYYRIEARVDKTGEGTAQLRIDGTADQVGRAVQDNAQQSFTFGMIDKTLPSPNSPGFVAHMDNVAFLAVTTGDTSNPPWWNTTTAIYDRTVDGTASFNDFAGVGSTTNIWGNVDEYKPGNAGTTYNAGGAINTLKSESHNLADQSLTTNVKGFTVYGRFQDLVNGTTDRGSDRMFVVDNGTQYFKSFSEAQTGNLHTEVIGYRNRPDDTTLTEAALNAMDIGYDITANYNTGTPTYLRGANNGVTQESNLLPISDGPTNDAWTTSNGTALAYTCVDNDISGTVEDGLWIKSSTVGQKQGFGVGSLNIGTSRFLSGVTLRFYDAAAESGVIRGGTYKGYYLQGGSYAYTPDYTAFFGDHLFTWGSNPHTGAAWTMANVTGNEWGVEVVNTVGTKYIAVDQVNVVLGLTSLLRADSIWVVTATGTAYTEVVRPTGTSAYIPTRMLMGAGF